MSDVRETVARVHRDEWARVVATIARRFGDLDIAEDATAEAFATALEHWATHGVPPNPGGWLTTTAGNKALDRVRREGRRDAKEEAAQMLRDQLSGDHEPVGAIDDDRLRMLFTCAHPALAMEARAALTLRMVGGLTVAEIAHAFLVQETTMAQRITRAKAKIKAAGIPYRVPDETDLPARVAALGRRFAAARIDGVMATPAGTAHALEMAHAGLHHRTAVEDLGAPFAQLVDERARAQVHTGQGQHESAQRKQRVHGSPRESGFTCAGTAP